MTTRIFVGDCREVMKGLPDRRYHTCVTSPPYWGLRDYNTEPLVWGGDTGCVHEWGEEIVTKGQTGGPCVLDGAGRAMTEARYTPDHTSQFCRHCGAWRGHLGLEPTPALYVEHMVEVFREVRRVMRDDAVLLLNLGDSYATGVGANINNLLAARLKEGIVLDGSRCALTITSKSEGVLKQNKLAPDDVFTRLFGVQRISVKQGNDDFCQILDGFAPIADCRVSPSIIATINQSNTEIVLDSQDGIRIVISECDLDTNTPFAKMPPADAMKHCQAPLTVKESSEPISESVGDIQATGDTIPLNTFGESVPQINLVDEPVTLADTFVPRPNRLRDLSVTKASAKKLALSLMGGRIEIAFSSVAHLFASNEYGSLMRYAEVYHQAEQMSNERKAKQELGILGMVKRALMRDGWICRSTIIWHKPNCMPESVTDRPTKSHEYVFLLTKSARYFWDADAVRERHARLWNPDTLGGNLSSGTHKLSGRMVTQKRATPAPNPAGRNIRTVWTIPTRSFKGAHFATFSPALVTPCIKAGSSERGCCPECGGPWERVTEKPGKWEGPRTRDGKYQGVHTASDFPGQAWQDWRNAHPDMTTGWQPTCECVVPLPQVPCRILDPFGGAGTVALVARQLGRDCDLIELSPAYAEMAQQRLDATPVLTVETGAGEIEVQQIPMFSEVTVQ